VTPGEIHDSPVGWVSRHIRSYVDTGGRVGHRRWGVTNLLLTTRGRRTGLLRRTALIYGRAAAAYVVVASGAGEPRHPAWYLNLCASPDVVVQVGADVFPARARTAEGEERARLWRMMVARWPDYRRYQYRSGRTLPVVVLEPQGRDDDA
jgi:deazaflavin-dependent oxidoreductase (nitroreductase family)